MSQTCRCGKPFVERAGGDMKTLVGYSSPPGHHHDNNCITRMYLCEDRHATIVSIKSKCDTPGCNWVGKSTCFCHGGEKAEPLNLPIAKLTNAEWMKAWQEGQVPPTDS